MASWIHSPLRLMPAPIHTDAVFCPLAKISIHTPRQRLSVMMKSRWIIHRFFDGIFSKLFFFFPFFFYPNKVIPPSLPHFFFFFLPFSTSFWALQYIFKNTHTHTHTHTHISPSISSTPAPFMFLHPHHPSFAENGAGVSATTRCVQRGKAWSRVCRGGAGCRGDRGLDGQYYFGKAA